MERPPRIAAATALVVLIGLVAVPASAAPGDIDTSFGDGGLATDGFGCGGSCAEANDVAVLENGRLLEVGFVNTESLPYFGVHAFTALFDADGEYLGPGFATSRGDLNALRAVAPTGDGGAITGGWARRCLDDLPLEECTLSRALFMVVKHNTAGGPNLAFDGDGVVLTPMGAGDAVATGVAPDGAGGVVAVGTAVDILGKPLMAIAHYLPDGRLDPAFGFQGRVLVPGVTGADVAVTANGKIVALGSADGELVILRRLPNGQLDTEFGTGGRVDVGFAARTATAADVAIAGAKVVAGGPVESPTGGIGFGVARLTAAGVLDDHFNDDGRVVTQFPQGDAALDELGVSADGTTVAIGGNGVACYTPRGLHDREFGGDGRVWLPWRARGLAMQDGGVVAAVFADGMALTRVEL